MYRITDDPEAGFSEEDRYALRVLSGPLYRPAHVEMLNRVAHPGREKDPTRRVGPSAVTLSPLIRVALSMLGTACIKGQAAGRFSPQAHWWGDLVVAHDLSQGGGERWHMMAQNASSAVSAGIRLEAIEALWGDDLDALTADERQYVSFARQVIAGSVDDESWAREVELVGSERGVMELTILYLYLAMLVRAGQVFGLEPDLDAGQLRELLDGLRAGTWPLIDVGEYSRAFEQDIFTRIGLD